MKREIKFRAWLPDLKKMETGWFGLRSDGKASFNSDCVLMQFTGLKNENNVEVYEGDIVKVGGLIEVVEYIDGILCCYNKSIYGNHEKVEIENYDDIIVPCSDYFEPYEVIGNIYENPELLNE